MLMAIMLTDSVFSYAFIGYHAHQLHFLYAFPGRPEQSSLQFALTFGDPFLLLPIGERE